MRECWFYRIGAARTPVNIPRCYYNAVDAATGESFLLLEDLAPARTGNRMNGASLEEAELALQSLAQLHASWWAVDPKAEPELMQLMDNSQDAQALVGQLYQEAWSRFLERHADQVQDDIRKFGTGLVDHIPEAEALLDASPRTLIHGDFRLENMLFGARHRHPVCWIIDWEDVILWNGMFDVAWFLGGCLPVEESDKEENLLRFYHRALTHAGVEGYSWEQCYRDYRCAMITGFVQGILTITSLETGDIYAQNLARVIAERFMMACSRLRLDELLP
jgi:aminoglycoside/choline kinase family phosphotransferase